MADLVHHAVQVYRQNNAFYDGLKTNEGLWCLPVAIPETPSATAYSGDGL